MTNLKELKGNLYRWAEKQLTAGEMVAEETPLAYVSLDGEKVVSQGYRLGELRYFERMTKGGCVRWFELS